MPAARWLPAPTISQSYAVHEAALFRYSQRGMIAARWDEEASTWLYDVMRVKELFLHRDAAVPAPHRDHLGTLGEVHLAGGSPQRRPDARQARRPLRVGELPVESPPGALPRAC